METKSFNKQEVISGGILLNNEYVFNEIQKSVEQLIIMYARPNNFNSKLAFISAILRDLNVKNILGKHKFIGTTFMTRTEYFEYNILLEHKNTEIKKSDNFIKDYVNPSEKIEEMEEDDNFDENLDLKTFPILSQRENLLNLFNQISGQTNHFDAAVNLTAFLALEFEMMSEKNLKRLLFFNEMYEIKNPLDKWMCAIEIKAKYEKNYFLLGINNKMLH